MRGHVPGLAHVHLGSTQSVVRAVRFAPGRSHLLCSVGLDMLLQMHDRRLDAVVSRVDAQAPLTALAWRADGVLAVGTAGVHRVPYRVLPNMFGFCTTPCTLNPLNTLQKFGNQEIALRLCVPFVDASFVYPTIF